MTITDVPLDQISPAEYNPRTLSQDAFERLQHSLDNFDFVEPVVVNRRDGKLIIIGGHQRVRAARVLGMETVPCNILENLPLGKEKALNIELNNRKTQGVDDLPALQELLMGIDDEFRDMSGYLDEEVAKLQDGWTSEVSDVEAVETTEKSKTKKYTLDDLQRFLALKFDEQQASELLAEFKEMLA